MIPPLQALTQMRHHRPTCLLKTRLFLLPFFPSSLLLLLLLVVVVISTTPSNSSGCEEGCLLLVADAAGSGALAGPVEDTPTHQA